MLTPKRAQSRWSHRKTMWDKFGLVAVNTGLWDRVISQDELFSVQGAPGVLEVVLGDPLMFKSNITEHTKPP